MIWLKRALWAYAFVGAFALAFVSSSALPPSPNPARFNGLVIAHRGDAIGFAENTLAAIDGASALGADAVEVDVMLSKDGIPVAFHDETLDSAAPPAWVSPKSLSRPSRRSSSAPSPSI